MHIRSFLFLLIPVFISTYGFAQQPPNADFEFWSDIGNDMDNPDGWDSSNEFIDLFPLPFTYVFNSVTRETDEPYSNNTCARMETISQSIFLVGEIKSPGLIALGDFVPDISTQTGTLEGGIYFPYRPARLKGYIRYLPEGMDSCLIIFGLYKYNNATQLMDTLGGGRFTSSAIPDWATFEIPVIYNSTEVPDTINLAVLSSYDYVNLNMNVGSTLWVDSLYFEYDSTASVAKRNGNPNVFSMFPNPAFNYVKIRSSLPHGFDEAEFQIYTIAGSLIQSVKLNSMSESLQIPLKTIDPGMYVCLIRKGNNVFYRDKLMILK
ncbi:MAG: PCMD domain-containing protein [Bacteroidales bacterium]|nr:PCMD domain-containing protein [Bacteroidales bacterium]